MKIEDLSSLMVQCFAKQTRKETIPHAKQCISRKSQAQQFFISFKLG